MKGAVRQYVWAVLIAGCMVSWNAGAAVWYVAPDGAGGGTSWADAGALQATVNAATSGDEVWVKKGTYTGSVDPVLDMKEGVAVYGGFAGSETDRGLRDWHTHTTIIDGEDARCCVYGPESGIFDGFTVTRGLRGMLNSYYASSLKIENCVFTSNLSSGGGGAGMFIGGPLGAENGPTVTNCVFTNNRGDGLLYASARVTVINCVFAGNDGYGLRGGYLHTVSNSLFWGNKAGQINASGSVTYSCVQGGYSGDGNISAAPLLVEDYTGQVVLQDGSPCIDSGTAEGAPSLDIRGVARPQGAGVDIGACEYGDADGDGVDDPWELRHFGSTTMEPGEDSDADGLTNLQELLMGTNPRNADTDGDGFLDGKEVALDHDPKTPTKLRRVSASNTSGVEDGLSWATAYPTLQAGLSSAAGEDGEVWVAAGTYTGVGGLMDDVEYVVVMEPNLQIFGGFAGTETEREQRDWGANTTVIDGENTRRCVYGAADSVWDGFTVTRASAGSGGAMYNKFAVAVRNCVFVGNGTTAMYNFFPSVGNASGSEAVNCLFVNNVGDGIYALGFTVGATSCLFMKNTGHGCFFLGSGGINAKNCIFWGNAAGSLNQSGLVTFSCVEGGAPGDGNIAGNPQLAANFSGGVNLRADSPCIDTGASLDILPFDFRSVARPQGQGFDMGPFEFLDTDGDAMDDKWEQDHVGGMAAGPGEDPDSDGLTNLQEYCAGTDPENSDTDADGMGDGLEISEGHNPVIPTKLRRVNALNTSGVEDGLSWETAYSTLQAGMNSAAGEDGEVWVAAGTYTGVGGMVEEVENVLVMASNVQMYGGFAGTEAFRTERDASVNLTIIDGEGVRRCVHGVSDSILDGFTVTRGKAGSGGGIHGEFPRFRVSNCKLVGNTAEYGGGGMCAGGGAGAEDATRVTNCVFMDNAAGNGGGGICNGAGFGSLEDTLLVVNCLFTGNRAGDTGGAVYDGLFYGGTRVTNCVSWGNTGDEMELSSYITITSSLIGATYPPVIRNYAGDFYLKASSSCIDSGTAGEAPSHDIRGVVRPQGLGIDKGPVEFVDSDGDEMDDVWEIRHLGGVSGVAGEDTDGDGLSNVTEYELGCHPMDVDSDKDGFEDGVEVQQGHDPAVPTQLRRVSASNTSGVEDGLSWETAYSTLQAGMDAAAGGDGEIWVAAGVYAGRGGEAQDAECVMVMAAGVQAYGGFAGTETARDQRSLAGARAVIDGEGVRRCVAAANSVVLDGFTFTRGAATDGAGVTTFGCLDVRVANCFFLNNAATCDGGGLYNSDAYTGGESDGFFENLEVVNCVFLGNRALRGGGMGHWYFRTATLVNCTFSGNSATDGLLSGGGIYNHYSAPLMVRNCIIWGNTPEIGTSVSENLAMTYSCVRGWADLHPSNIDADPLFLDAGAGNVQLQAGSPCVDTGTGYGAPTFDILGSVRPQGGGCDMGAFESPFTGRVTVPAVAGMTLAAAQEAIQRAGLVVGAVGEESSSTVPAGQVIRQDPEAGATVLPGSPVDLAVSKGPEPAPPTPDEARTALAAAFDAADTDGDGRLSFAEAEAVLPGLTQEVFNELDTNADGYLDREELGLPADGCGCTGCKKSGMSLSGVRKRVGDLFLGGLVLVSLVLLRRGGSVAP